MILVYFLLSPAGSRGLSQLATQRKTDNIRRLPIINVGSKWNQKTSRQDTKVECDWTVGSIGPQPIKLSIKRKFHARDCQKALSLLSLPSLALPDTSQAKNDSSESDTWTSQAESKRKKKKLLDCSYPWHLCITSYSSSS